MKALKIVAVSDQKASPNSTRFYSKSLSATAITVTKVQYHSKPTSSSIDFSSLRSSSSPAVTTHCLPLSESQEGLRSETTDICKSVHVKFLINIECQFGDHILMVGDDPLLGLWSPFNAIPFNWSEGHLWTLVLEMPVDKSFKYKFLLKKSSGEILWQPGPDRVFTTQKTENVIVVIEEWATAEAQKVIEEPCIDKNEELISNTLVDDNAQIVAENIDVSISDENADVAKDCSDSGSVDRNRSGLNPDTGAKETPFSSTSSDKNSQRRTRTQTSGHRGGVRAKKSSSVVIEDEESLITCEEGPVLVPGLTVMLMESEKDIVNEHEMSTVADSRVWVEVTENQEYHLYRFD